MPNEAVGAISTIKFFSLPLLNNLNPFNLLNILTIMHYFRFVLLLLTVIISQNASAQKEDKAIKTVINRFFEAMQKRDTATLRSTCMPMPVLQTYMKNREGKLDIISEDFAEFVAFVGSPSSDKFEEKIEFEAIHTEQSLASVWTPYKFYLNGKLSHTGTNSFQLVKTAQGWKIQYILDTRRKG